MLIYCSISAPRLQYICKFIFAQFLNAAYSITTDAESFCKQEGPTINYSNEDLSGRHITIRPQGLLFESAIDETIAEKISTTGFVPFFTTNGNYAFDIFSASFYLLSRYEEYVPHLHDMYGRYAHENSIAYKEGFLNRPVVNNWIIDFAAAVQQQFGHFVCRLNAFSIVPSYDIDIAWSYLHKGAWRSIGGFLKRPDVKRWLILSGIGTDPFDCYEFLHQIHLKYSLHPLYFFLVAQKNGHYDKNILPSSPAMQHLIKTHAAKYDTGIHPSWASYNHGALIKKEKQLLEDIAEKEITRSRQHYIKMTLPQTYDQLIEAGITDDYSMGYGSINGFRASVASSFNWFNLQTNKETNLCLHPFCFMDANSFYEQKQDAQQTAAELQHYLNECRKASGTLVSVFHNNILGTEPVFNGWRKMYGDFIAQALS